MSHGKPKHHKTSKKPWIASQQINFVRKSKILEPSISTSEGNVPKELKLADNKERRIIMREMLFKDPDEFKWKFEVEDSSCIKSDESVLQNGNDKIVYKQPNKMQKKIEKMLSTPIEITKAGRMMEKMGWSGGALGKHGEGIIAPIAPNASYATKTIGFGQDMKRAKINLKEEPKEYFYTNVLLNVLDFVKCELENEIAFDHNLSRKERKLVHNTIEDLGNKKNNFETDTQMDIAEEIFKCNEYLLTTESQGSFPNRYLCVYKEAPDHMYLITPDDLKEVKEVQNSEEINEKKLNKQSINAIIQKNTESNNELSVNISEVNEDINGPLNLETECLIKLLNEYFTEFIDDEKYTDFRFLGPFSNTEIEAINIFIEKCKSKDLIGEDIEILENCNGYTIGGLQVFQNLNSSKFLKLKNVC